MSTKEPRCFDPSTYTKGQEVASYFTKVADLHDKFDVYKALASSGITPQAYNSGKSYPRDDVLKALKAGLGVMPQVNCTKGNTGEIEHVNIMFKVQGRDNFIAIDNDQAGNCPERIKFPLKYDTTRPTVTPPPPKPTTGSTGSIASKPVSTTKPAETNGGFFSRWLGGGGTTPAATKPAETKPSESKPGVFRSITDWFSGRTSVVKE
jgi:hypothetical protein